MNHVDMLKDELPVYLYLKENQIDGAEFILRNVFAMTLSALDSYIHNVVLEFLFYRIRIGELQECPLDVDLGLIVHAYNSDEYIKESAIHGTLVQRLKKDSYISPKGIEYAMKLVGINNVWSKISEGESFTASHIRDVLSVIANRRNQIVHEFDYDNGLQCCRSICLNDVNECMKVIDVIVRKINGILNESLK